MWNCRVASSCAGWKGRCYQSATLASRKQLPKVRAPALHEGRDHVKEQWLLIWQEKSPPTRWGMQSGKVEVTRERGLCAAHSSCLLQAAEWGAWGFRWNTLVHAKEKPATGWEIRGHLQPFNFINQRCQALRKQLCTTVIRLMVTTIMIIKLLE